MKSRFFKDTQGLDQPFDRCAPDKVSVCLRLSRQAYAEALAQAQRLQMTSGSYIEALILRDRQPDGERGGGTIGASAPMTPTRAAPLTRY